MYSFFRAALVCFNLLLLSFSATAADSGWLKKSDKHHAQVRIWSEQTDSASQVRLLLDVKLDPDWKTYWRSPGAGGLAPEIKWNSPDIQTQWNWPVPQWFDVAGISTQGYKNSVSFPIVLKGQIPQQLSGVLTLSSCSNVCVLTDFPFSLNLQDVQDANFDAAFARASGQIPIASGMIEPANVSATYSNGLLQVTATRPSGWASPMVFSDILPGAEFHQPQITVDGETLLAKIKVTPDWAGEVPELVNQNIGMVISDRGIAQEIPLKISAGSATADSESSSGSIWVILLMALAGGLILNLMPCVLPVLGIKISTLLQSQPTSKSEVKKQFLASAMGILTSFWILALLMTVLSALQISLGWGIQFQSPWFIGFMVVVTGLFTANLFGLFTIRLSSGVNTRLATTGNNGYSGHFLQGLFATLLATPCSAPFLGTAVAFALASSLPVMWLIFTALGIGMSLPWLLIALFPSAALLLPKPGRWMNGLRLVMAGLMLASSLWLISLLTAHLGQTYTLIIGGALIAGLLLATAIRFGTRRFIQAALFSLAISAIVWSLSIFSPTNATSLTEDRVHWQPLSEQAITQALSEGKTVFVDVTADWCITCKVNKYNVLLSPEVQSALSADDIVALRGDWTTPSEEITRFLKSRNSVSVPFNQIYGPALTQGEIMSPILTKEKVLNTLSSAKKDHLL